MPYIQGRPCQVLRPGTEAGCCPGNPHDVRCFPGIDSMISWGSPALEDRATDPGGDWDCTWRAVQHSSGDTVVFFPPRSLFSGSEGEPGRPFRA